MEAWLAEIRIYSSPQNLYRYRRLGKDIERELDAIENAYIYCPHFSSMNDPMEGTHRMSLRFLAAGTSKAVQEEVQREQQTIGIASFSEVYNHEPMWAHYADQFQGICIQYNTRLLLSGLPDDVQIARMQYSEQAPVVLEEQKTPADRARMALSNKTVRWASEREWRAFAPSTGPANYKSVDVVKRIYLGARISQTDEARIRTLANRLKINVAKMVVRSYSLEFSGAK